MKIVRQYSHGELVTFDWLCHQLGWPFSPPDTILDLVHLEAVHDVFDLYLWLSYRFAVGGLKFQSTVKLGISKLFGKGKKVYYCQVFTIYHVIYVMICQFGMWQKVY